MRKIWWVLMGCFWGGILLCGLGVGICFVELSNMTYGDEYEVGEMVQETLTYEIDDNVERYYISSNFYMAPGQNIISDNSLPENKIEIEVTYNNQLSAPYLYDTFYYDTNEDTIEGTTEVALYECNIHIICEDNGRSFWKYKDVILEDLKNGRLNSYRLKTEGTDMVIRCNPAVASKLIVQ